MSGGNLQKKSTKYLLAGVIAILFFAVIVGLLFVRARKEQQGGGTRGDGSALPDSVCLSGGNSYTDQGILYFDDHFIRFANAETGTDSVICTDANCRHEDSRNSECGAYIGGGGCSGLVQRGERIYYLIFDDESGKQILYSANLQGKDRTKIAELIEMNHVVDVIYHGQTVLISYVNMDYEGDGLDTCGIYGYDMEKNEGKQYYQREGNGSAINSLLLRGDILYFSYHGSNATKEEILEHSEDEAFELEHKEVIIKGIHLGNGEEVVSTEGYGSNCVLPYCDGKVFYTKDDINYYYDENSKENIEISKENLIPIYSAINEKALFIGSGAAGKNLFLQFDPEHSEMKTLCESDLYPIAVLEKKTYVLLDDGERGVLDTQDFLQGKHSEYKHL